jgi:hypothetical protein
MLHFSLETSPPWLVTLVSSELLLLIARARTIDILVRNRTQRSAAEQRSVDRGSSRSLFLEILLFVPASAVLSLLILPPPLIAKFPWLISLPANRIAFYAGLGLTSYGFPFATIRHVVTRAALNTLQEFVSLHNRDDAELPVKPAGRGSS